MGLIQEAYDRFAAGKVNPLNPGPSSIEIEGAPGWVGSDSYSIEARAATPETIPMMRGPMMRALLERRFYLKIHRESREVPAYLMTVAEGGPKLKRTEEGSCEPVTADDFIGRRAAAKRDIPWCADGRPSRKDGMLVYDVHGMTLEYFCSFIRLDRPVFDRTGLSGMFDIHLRWVGDPPPGDQTDGVAPAEPPGASLVAAIRAQLGLQIRLGKAEREFLVIDHIQRPSEN